MTSPIDRTTHDLVRRPVAGWRGKPLSRRLFLAGTAGATLGLTACGGDRSTPAVPSPTGSGGFPVTVVGKEGTATIQAKPQRVVALGFQRDAETALALGVIPIAMPENSSFASHIAPWTEQELAGSKPELLNAETGIPFERIVGLRPDLILATDSYELADIYTRLTQIAPTVSYLEGPDADTWQQRTTLIGNVLGRDEQAQKIITDVEAKVTQAARDNPAFAGKAVSFSVIIGQEVYTVLEDDSAMRFLGQLGLRISPEVAAQPESSTPGRALVSLENLSVLDADIVIIAYPTEGDRTFLESNQLFQQLDAVKNGTYIPLDFPVAVALGFPSPLAIPYALDRTVAAVAKALAS